MRKIEDIAFATIMACITVSFVLFNVILFVVVVRIVSP